MLRALNLLFLILIVILVSILAYLNADDVVFDYLAGQTTLPLAILLVLCFIAGVAVAVIASFGIIMQLRVKISRLKKQQAYFHDEKK